MGFWTALSALAPIAPAQAEAQEIRRQRGIQDTEASQNAQLNRERIAQEQQKTKAGLQDVILDPKPTWDPVQNSYTVLAQNSTKGLFRKSITGGESPEAEQKRKIDSDKALFRQVTGHDPNEQQGLDLAYGALGIKPASATGQRPQLKTNADGSYAWVYPPDATGQSTAPVDVKDSSGKAFGGIKQKAQTLDQQYQQILIKQAAGQPLTPDEQARSAAWKVWTKESKIDPGVARAQAFGANRYIMVIDPNDPEKVVPMRAIDAARSGVGTPGGISFQTDKALTRAFTSGAPAQTINYFNTATEHLKQLQEAADALNNGDIQLFNKAANSWATNTGNPAPTNFATIRNAVAGELSKTFKGAAATDAEIDAINTSINSSQSPAQLSGAIGNNIRLMGSKMDALRGQYEAGKQGKPNFPTAPGKVKMRAPDGSTSLVDSADVKHYETLGATVVK